MIGIPIGLVASNATEWFIHKHLLHGLGKNPRSFWSFHWHEHHRNSRKNDMRDPQYERSIFSWGPEGKEVAGLLGLAALVTPLLPVAPFFTGTVYYRLIRYYQVHRKAHLDPEWARENLPWHVDHHMGKNQNLNWCVTHPFFDWVMGTRKDYGAASSRSERAEDAPAADAAVAS